METPPRSPNVSGLLDIEDVSREIRRRVQDRLPQAPAPATDEPPSGVSPAGVYQRGPVHMGATEELCRCIESGQLLAGNLPPQPATLRGRLGHILVEVVRRMLFWYTQPLRTFQQMTASALREESVAIRKMDGDQRRLELAAREVFVFARRAGENDSALYQRVFDCERELRSETGRARSEVAALEARVRALETAYARLLQRLEDDAHPREAS